MPKIAFFAVKYSITFNILLTVFVLAKVVIGRFRRFTTACLVMSLHTEAVNSPFLQSRHRHLAFCVRSVDSLNPVHGKLFFVFDGIVSNGPAAVLLGGSPLQHNHRVVIINDIGLTRSARLI